jgi:hypothetical protein
LELGGSNATQRLCIANNALIGVSQDPVSGHLTYSNLRSPIADSSYFKKDRVVELRQLPENFREKIGI